jgi:hypothetical protein
LKESKAGKRREVAKDVMVRRGDEGKKKFRIG